MPSTPDAYSNLGETTVDQFKPLNGFVLLKRRDAATHVGRIIVINRKDQRYEQTIADVIKTGHPDKADKTGAPIPFAVKPGDAVAIDKFAGHDIVLQGTAYVLAKEADIHGVLERAA